MKYILTAEQMKRADQVTIKKIGILSLVLMERAALACVDAMKRAEVDLGKALIVCGSGNNGGDGFAVARLLIEEGYQPEVVFVGRAESRSEENKVQMEILEEIGGIIGNCFKDREYSVIIDAVFGIGLSREVGGSYKEVIERMNGYQAQKVAVDLASGISADTGEVLGTAFRADLTVTFAYGKRGQILYPGCEYTGELVIAPIGISDALYENDDEAAYVLEREDLASLMPVRKADSNKGTYGKVLMVTGSKGMAGAAFLSAAAAYHAGAGLVRIYTEDANRAILQQLLPEAIISTYDSNIDDPFAELSQMLAWCDVSCVGCGIGRDTGSEELMRRFLSENEKPCVLDADALNLIASLKRDESGALPKDLYRKTSYILTPHMKEMERLSGQPVSEWKKSRFSLLDEFAEEGGAVCVLKDSRTIVKKSGKPFFINTSGNAAMAKGGSGDVLAGIITGLLAQGEAPFEAAVLGVYLHGLSGDLMRKEKGAYSVMAGDLFEGIGRILKALEEETR